MSSRVDGETSGNLIVVSNRGPLRQEDGRWVRSAGGLVTALDPLLRRQNGLWVSAGESETDSELPDLGYRQRLVQIPEDKRQGFYSAFSNGVLWPTLHGFSAMGQIDEAPWGDYEDANRGFAEAVLEYSSDGDLLWVHDYHLMRTPLLVRNTQSQLRIGWFCHIPWPDSDHFATLPWRRELLEGLLGANVIGFHSAKYRSHFMDCAEEFADATVDRERCLVESAHGPVRVVVAPIGIAGGDVQALVESEAVQRRKEELRRAVNGRRIVLGVDRLDYTKGIPERLSSFARLLEQRPALTDEVVLIQIVVPSRETVGAYAELKESLERLVGQLNGQLSRTGQVPIHYIYRSLEPQELYAHYLAAEVAMVTPLRDGMNLVALEYIASRVNEDGALVLSEFAGAAEHLEQAFLVNPYDIDSVAGVLGEALDVSPEEARRRMRALRARVAGLDVHEWAEQFLRHLRERTSDASQESRPGELDQARWSAC